LKYLNFEIFIGLISDVSSHSLTINVTFEGNIFLK